MTNSSRAADITRTCIRSSCWKKSWNAHEQPARRGSTRQSLRFAPDAPLAAVHAAVQVARHTGSVLGCHRHSAGVEPADNFWLDHSPLLFARPPSDPAV